MLCSVLGRYNVLIDHLHRIVVNALFINQHDILALSVITAQNLNVILLDKSRLFHDTVLGIGKNLGKEAIPLVIGKVIIIQLFKLTAEVFDQVLFFMYGKAFIPKLNKEAYKFRFQLCLALISVRTLVLWLIFSYNCAFATLGNNIKITHINLR